MRFLASATLSVRSKQRERMRGRDEEGTEIVIGQRKTVSCRVMPGILLSRGCLRSHVNCAYTKLPLISIAKRASSVVAWATSRRNPWKLALDYANFRALPQNLFPKLISINLYTRTFLFFFFQLTATNTKGIIVLMQNERCTLNNTMIYKIWKCHAGECFNANVWIMLNEYNPFQQFR